MRDKTAAAIAVCSVETTVSIIGGCWKLTIIQELLDRTLRYGELRRAVGEVTDRVLTRQLRELEDDGLVHREGYADAWGQTWVAAQQPATSDPARSAA